DCASLRDGTPCRTLAETSLDALGYDTDNGASRRKGGPHRRHVDPPSSAGYDRGRTRSRCGREAFRESGRGVISISRPDHRDPADAQQLGVSRPEKNGRRVRSQASQELRWIRLVRDRHEPDPVRPKTIEFETDVAGARESTFDISGRATLDAERPPDLLGVQTDQVPRTLERLASEAVGEVRVSDGAEGPLPLTLRPRLPERRAQQHDRRSVGRQRFEVDHGSPSSRPAATASANGNTGPLPRVWSSHPATVSVQRESTTSSTRRTGPGSTFSAITSNFSRALLACWKLFCIAFCGGASCRTVSTSTYGRPKAAASRVAKSWTIPRCAVDGSAVTQVGSGLGRQRSLMARAAAVTSSALKAPSTYFPRWTSRPNPASP